MQMKNLALFGLFFSLGTWVAACPPGPTDDDDSAQPGDPRVAAAVVDAIGWPAEVPGPDTVTMAPAAICPQLPAELQQARDAFVEGDEGGAEAVLRAYFDGGGDDPSGVGHLLLGTLLQHRDEHVEAVLWLGTETLHAGPLSGDAAASLGASLEELERWDEAATAYRRVPPPNRLFDRARVRLAAIALEQDRADDAITALLPLLADPAELGSRWRAEGLLLLGRAFLIRGSDGDDTRAYEAFRTAWATAPLSDVAADVEAEMDALQDQMAAELLPAVGHELQRAAAYHQAGHWNSTIKALQALQDRLADDPVVQCEFSYMYGRSLYKRRKYTEADPHLERAANDCAAVESDLAAKALYMRARGLERLDRLGESADAWVQLPQRFPEHSYADDGYLRAAMVEMERDDRDAARTHLEALVASFPEGDMFGEALWRLAWGAYREGDTERALQHLGHLQQEYDRSRDRRAYLRARYWEAKILGWPDGEGLVVQRDPAQESPAADQVRAAALLESLADEHPMSWYGTLAYHRLRTIDPSRAQSVADRLAERRDTVGDLPDLPQEWDIDRRFWERPQREIAQALACAGLRRESSSELRRARASTDPWDWQTEQQIALIAQVAGDYHTSHNTLRVRFRTDHPEQLSAASWSALRLAYPLAYHTNVRGAVAGKEIPALLFQGLVREESAFQVDVVSWAGANGLSQLMWATAKDTARKMGIKGLRRADLADPDTNLAIGAHYLHLMSDNFDGNLPCAVGSYNAGPGAMGRWLSERGGYPLDEFVEDVPYKETRNYIKRVFESYQTYHHLYEGDPVFVHVPMYVPQRS